MKTARINLGTKAFTPFRVPNIQVWLKKPVSFKLSLSQISSRLKEGQIYYFLGEVKNAPGHGIFADSEGILPGMYPLELFYVELEDIKDHEIEVIT